MTLKDDMNSIKKYCQIVDDRKAGMSCANASRKAGYDSKFPEKSFDKLRRDLKKRGLLNDNAELTDSAKNILESNGIQNNIAESVTKSKVIQSIPAESINKVVKRNPAESKRSNKKDLRRRIQIDLDEEDIEVVEKQARDNERTITNYCKYLIRKGAGLI